MMKRIGTLFFLPLVGADDKRDAVEVLDRVYITSNNIIAYRLSFPPLRFYIYSLKLYKTSCFMYVSLSFELLWIRRLVGPLALAIINSFPPLLPAAPVIPLPYCVYSSSDCKSSRPKDLAVAAANSR
jgi:hypothetical protein